MVTWSLLPTIAAADWFSKSLVKRAEELAAAVGKLTAGRAALDGRIERLKAGDEGVLLDAEALRLSRYELLRQEVVLRADVTAFYQAREVERVAAQEKAAADHQAVTEQVARGLVEFGYDAPVDGEPNATAYRPDFLFRHKKVFMARVRRDELSALADAFRGQEQANQAAIEGAEIQLRAARERAAALA